LGKIISTGRRTRLGWTGGKLVTSGGLSGVIWDF